MERKASVGRPLPCETYADASLAEMGDLLDSRDRKTGFMPPV